MLTRLLFYKCVLIEILSASIYPPRKLYVFNPRSLSTYQQKSNIFLSYHILKNIKSTRVVLPENNSTKPTSFFNSHIITLVYFSRMQLSSKSVHIYTYTYICIYRNTWYCVKKDLYIYIFAFNLQPALATKR